MLILTSLQKGKLNSRNRFVAPPSGKRGSFDDAQLNFLPVGHTAEAHFENGALMDWIRNEKRPTMDSFLQAIIYHSSVYAILQAVIKPVYHRAYVFLSIKDVETLRSIGWYCAAFDYVRGIVSELSSSVVAMKAIAYARSCFGIFFFSVKKVGLMRSGFAILPS